MQAGLDSDGSQWGFNKWELLKICQVWYKISKVTFSNTHKRNMKWPLFIMYPRNCCLYAKNRILNYTPAFQHCIKVKLVFHLQTHIIKLFVSCRQQKREDKPTVSPGFGLSSHWPFPAGLGGLHSAPCFCLSDQRLVILRSYRVLSWTQFWDWALSTCFYVLDYVCLCACVCTHTHTSVCIASI